MLLKPFEKSYPMTQDWNDPRYRSSYTRFGLLGHNGQDFGVPVGTPILAPHDGKIIENANDTNGYGCYVKIESEVEGSILGHFKELSPLKVGESVKQGQQVGLSGNTGNSTGPHLHWGYYRMPRKRDNGFSGTVDQTHWMDIKDYSKELDDMRESRNKWRTDYKALVDSTDKEIKDLMTHRDLLQKDLAEANIQLDVLKRYLTTNKTPLSAYSIKERFQSIVHSLLNGGDFNA